MGKGRGLCAWDLIKPASRFKTIKTQQEIQECRRPSFDHPKILHILIDRAAGYGCKKLAAAHGASHCTISKFCQSIGFDIIKPHEVIDKQPNPKRLSLEERAIKLMEEDRTSELKSIAKYDEQRHWGAQDHPATNAWRTHKRWRDDPEYRVSRLAANISEEQRERRREYRKQYDEDNREAINEYASRYSRDNRDKMRESRRRSARKQRKDPLFRMKENARKRSRKYIKTPGLSWVGYGCTSDEYRAHMEKQFTKRMTWDNYGTYWHDDHIRPVASFDWSDPEQRRQCEHYTNKQPLEAKKNIAKSDSWDGQIGFNHMLCA